MNEKFRNCVYFLTFILPDYMVHDIPKEFLKSWFPSEVSKFTLANSSQNDAFSGMEKYDSHK